MEQTHIFMGMAIFAAIGAVLSIWFWRMEHRDNVGSMESMVEL